MPRGVSASVGACSPLAARFDRTIAIITIPAANIVNWGMIRQIFFIVAIPGQSRRLPRTQYGDFDRLNSTPPQNSGHCGSMSIATAGNPRLRLMKLSR
jgi:hypothetical protein